MNVDYIKISIVAASVGLIVCPSAQPQSNQSSRNGIVLERTKDGGFPSTRIRPLVLTDGRMVVCVADSIYMLAPDGAVLWKYATQGETLTSEPAFNAELNEIGVVGNDLLFVRLDATTGKLKWRATTAGRAGFSSVTAYANGYLVVVDMTGYRENSDKSKVRIQDQLEFWTDQKDRSWKVDFPTGAEVLVSGNRILA
jgi:outer membrane protein assembly factor BamB